MFWGLIMEPQRRYTQQVKKAFHISMAALDVSTSSDEPAQVMCGFEGRNYLLCTLRKPDMLQCPLDLNFDVGSEVSFAANGKCHVHLTGYLTDEFIMTEEEAEEEQNTELFAKNKKRIKKSLENGPPNKKTKRNSQVSSSQDKESDSDDSDLDVNTLLEKSLPESDDDSDVLEEEENGEEEDDEEEEDEIEEEEESSLSEEENEAEHEKQKFKINGIPKKQEKQEKHGIKESGEKKRKDKDKKITKHNQKKESKILSKESQTLKKRTIQGGVIVEDLKEGHGTPAKAGRFVNVYYEGKLKQNNKVFDATTKGSGFSFRLGSGEVIKGWDVGVLGMKSGGKRRITCPPSMAYGQKGSPPAIPPNSTLVFEVELKKIS